MLRLLTKSCHRSRKELPKKCGKKKYLAVFSELTKQNSIVGQALRLHWVKAGPREPQEGRWVWKGRESCKRPKILRGKEGYGSHRRFWKAENTLGGWEVHEQQGRLWKAEKIGGGREGSGRHIWL